MPILTPGDSLASAVSAGKTAFVLDAAALLQIYDEQLRGEAEMVAAVSRVRHGPLFWGTYVGGRGHVSYGPLPADADVARLVAETVHHFARDPEVTSFEWKTRGHDRVPDLDHVLRAHDLVPEEAESVMLGEAAAVAVDGSLPDGVGVRRIESEADVRRMCAMQAAVFGDDEDQFEEIWHRLQLGGDDLELWIAEADGVIISAGRLEPVPGTEVAGIWGGCTRPQWRGQGIYRTVTAERARSALRRGFRYLHSDSTEFSRPILERSGFVRITTTTPYLWRA